MRMQSESVTLSVDYLISSAQAGFVPCLGFFCLILGVFHCAPRPLTAGIRLLIQSGNFTLRHEVLTITAVPDLSMAGPLWVSVRQANCDHRKELGSKRAPARTSSSPSLAPSGLKIDPGVVLAYNFTYHVSPEVESSATRIQRERELEPFSLRPTLRGGEIKIDTPPPPAYLIQP